MAGFAELVESGKASAGELAGEMNGGLRDLGLAELAGNTVLFAGGSNGLCSDGLPPPWDRLLLAGGMAGDLHRGPQQRGCHDRYSHTLVLGAAGKCWLKGEMQDGHNLFG